MSFDAQEESRIEHVWSFAAIVLCGVVVAAKVLPEHMCLLVWVSMKMFAARIDQCFLPLSLALMILHHTLFLSFDLGASPVDHLLE